MLEGEHMGMKQVRIPLDGHHPIALFTPDHVYNTPEQVTEESSIKHTNSEELCAKTQEKYTEQPKTDILPRNAVAEMINAQREIFLKESVGDFIQHTIDLQKVENFKAANWDHERNHLRIDKLDEFYQLWRKVMTPSDFAEAPAEKPKNKAQCRKCQHLDYDHLSDQKEFCQAGEHFCGLHGRTRVDPDGEQMDLNHKGGCGFIQKQPTPKPSKKMLRSTGQQQFVDSTQLSLFE